MPTLVWLYLTALLYYRTSATCVAFAEALQTMSHDRLTRLLQARLVRANAPGSSKKVPEAALSNGEGRTTFEPMVAGRSPGSGCPSSGWSAQSGSSSRARGRRSQFRSGRLGNSPALLRDSPSSANRI
jgi:hypothetical protein